MVQRRRPAPHQPDRLGEELRQTSEHQRRQAPKAGPFGDGVSVDGVVFTAAGSGSVSVRHHLGRVPKGLLVTYTSALLTKPIYAASWDRDTITLATTAPAADVTTNVWVF